MKKQALLFSLAALISIFAALLISSCDSCKSLETCSLPAPKSITATPTNPTTATLDWSVVPSAFGYRIVVVDTTSGLIFGTFDTGTNQLELSGLTPFHVYKGIVSAKCENGVPSLNTATVTWLQDGIIIHDEVVMYPSTGLEDCECTEMGEQRSAITGNQEFGLANMNLNANGPQRVVYQIELFNLTDPTVIRTFKIGFDYNCGVIKVFRNACKSDNGTISVELPPANAATKVEFKQSTTRLATLTPINFNGVTGDLSLTNLKSGWGIKYKQCVGTWVPDCLTGQNGNEES